MSGHVLNACAADRLTRPGSPHSRGCISAGSLTAFVAPAASSPLGTIAVGVTSLLMLFAPAVAGAEAVRGVHSLVTAPIAVRGGVLMVPLGADRAGDNWPQTLTLRLAHGGRIEGVVAWVHPAPPTISRHWTDDPRGLAVRRIELTDDTSADGAGAPYLLARLPPDGDGRLHLGRQTLRPQWHDLPGRTGPPAGQAPNAATLQFLQEPDRPDPRSPFEYWRWVLLAQRLGMNPPSPHAYGDVASLVAEHYAGLWRVGFTRLAALSPGVAAQCTDLLTQTCLDQQQSFAAWVADPVVVGSLLAHLLDFNRPDRAVMEAALAWADARQLLLLWPEPATYDQVTLAIANPTYRQIVAKFSWLDADDIPVAVQLEPGVLTRVSIDRPTTAPGPAAGERLKHAGTVRQVLLVESAGQRQGVSFDRDVLTAVPPGVFLAPLSPPLTLWGVQSRRRQPVAAARSTMSHLRKLNRRWEVFLECLRPAQSAHAAQQGDLFARGSFRDTRGIEAVTLLLGPESSAGGPSIVLTVPESSRHRLFRGSDDGTLEIHRRSLPDRWFCRIVLPDRWLAGMSQGGPTLIGLVRTHGDGDAAETVRNATVPWRPLDPGRAAIDLTAWDALPVP